MTLPPPPDRPQQWTQVPPQQQWSQQPAGPGSSWGHQPPHQGPAPAARTSSRARTVLIGVVAGIVVSALVVGGLTLANVVHFGSDRSVADTRPVELPETLGGLTDIATAAESRGGSASAVGDRYRRTYTRTADAYRAAFDGAAVGVRTYTTSELDRFLTVIAVRADSPGLVSGPQADVADLKLAASPGILDLAVDGDVECLRTVRKTIPQGQDVPPEDRITTVCRTTADTLTVFVFAGSVQEGEQGHQQMIELTRAARSAVVGS